MTTSVWYTPAPWRGLRLMAVGAVILALGVGLFWFEISPVFGSVVFLIGFAIVVWGQVSYIRALRAGPEGTPATSPRQSQRAEP